MVPGTEALSSMASQGVRLYAVTHLLLSTTPLRAEVPRIWRTLAAN